MRAAQRRSTTATKAEPAKLQSSVDELRRIFKDSHRVLAKRVRALEIRVGAQRPRYTETP
jgi:peptidoglycan hydrolase CwlO-like protein